MEALEENPSQSNTVEFVQWSKGNFEKIYSVSLFIVRFRFRHARVSAVSRRRYICNRAN